MIARKLIAAAALFAAAFMAVPQTAVAQGIDIAGLPREIYSGEQGAFHVQGIAADLEHGYFYFSFTTSLLKTDLQGNLLGSVVGMTGHLGCMSINPDDGHLYASIEYKHDAIGKGILDKLDGNVQNDEATGFYIAIFDLSKIDRIGMNAQTDGVMQTVYIKEAVTDYYAEVENGGKRFEHRHGCSGIDGVTFAPAFGRKGGRNYLYVAYGIYGDKERTDNDYQVILAYDVRNWARYEQPLTPENLHKSGPEKPLHKYFLYTGNTSWGIQNLAYDRSTGNIYAAVYRGKKESLPNYSLFVIDGGKKPHRELLKGYDPAFRGEVLSLAEQGLYHEASGTWGYNFKWGTTGLCPIGDGYFYISHNAVTADKKHQSSRVKLYRISDAPDEAFTLVE